MIVNGDGVMVIVMVMVVGGGCGAANEGDNASVASQIHRGDNARPAASLNFVLGLTTNPGACVALCKADHRHIAYHSVPAPSVAKDPPICNRNLV